MSTWIPPVNPPPLPSHYLPLGAVDTSIDAALVADLELALEKRQTDLRSVSAPAPMGHVPLAFRARERYRSSGVEVDEDEDMREPVLDEDPDQIASDEFSEGGEPLEDGADADMDDEDDDLVDDDNEDDDDDDDDDLAGYL